MKRYFIFLLIVLNCNLGAVASNINIDTLFVNNVVSIENYLNLVIDGYILPSGNIDNPIAASIDGRPVITNYTDSTKFYIYGEYADFLNMFEDISNYKWERNSYVPNIMINRQEILMVKDWYETNRKRLNCEKVKRLFQWYNRLTPNIHLRNKESLDKYHQEKELIKRLETFIDYESSTCVDQ